MFLKIPQNLQENTCARVSFLIKLQAEATLQPATLLKKRLWHRCFPMNFAKFLRTLFLYSIFGGCYCKRWIMMNQNIKTRRCGLFRYTWITRKFQCETSSMKYCKHCFGFYISDWMYSNKLLVAFTSLPTYVIFITSYSLFKTSAVSSISA